MNTRLSTTRVEKGHHRRAGCQSGPPIQRGAYLRVAAFCLALAFAGLTATALAGSAAASFPGSKALLNAQLDDGNWILPAKSYSGNRFTALTQISETNVGTLSMAWKTNIADDGQQEASPIIWNGTMYLSTPHDGPTTPNTSCFMP
jgi:glucose dehydrogenase